MIRRCLLVVQFLIVGSINLLASGDSNINNAPRVNTVSIALFGGFPVPVYGLSVFVPTDSTEESCWMITFSGYKNMWASPEVVLSGSIGWNIRPLLAVTIRPTIGLGDGGIAYDGQFLVMFTIHVGLWGEYQVSHRVSFFANCDKRFDIAYRFWSPWGISAGIRVNLER
jgi:hypothetical protein